MAGANPESPSKSYQVRTIVLSLALMACGACGYRLLGTLERVSTTPPPLDDAYMFSRYADHLLTGLGMAWNPDGVQTYGCTSLAYALWVALIRSLDVVFWRALGLASWLPAAFLVPVLGMACKRAGQTPLTRNALVGMGFAAICIVVQNPFFFHATSGMDTTIAMLVNALLLVMVVDRRASRSTVRLIMTAIVAYLSFLTRPDSFLIAAILPTIMLLPGGENQSSFKPAIVFWIALVVLLVIDTATKSAIFSNPLPIPFFAKRGGFYEGYVGVIDWNPISYTRLFVVNQAVPILVICLFATRRSARLLTASLIPTVLTLGFLATATQIMGYQARFYYPSMPLFIVTAYYVLSHRWMFGETPPVRDNVRTILCRMSIIAFLIILNGPLAGIGQRWWESSQRQSLGQWFEIQDQQKVNRYPRIEWGNAAQALSQIVQSAPVEATWAMSEHGYIGAVSPNVTIWDLAGLHDRNTLTDTPIVDHVLGKRPDAIWLPHPDYVGMVRAIETDESFVNDYDYWPGAFAYGLALRRQSPHYAALRQSARAVWRETYQFSMPRPARRNK